MARVSKRILGNMRGRVGQTVFSKHGKQYLAKSLPQRKKKRPKNAPLSVQNKRIQLISSMLPAFKAAIDLGFKSKNGRASPYTRATKYNLTHAIKGAHPDFEIDYTKFTISDGRREIAWAPQLSFEPEGWVTVKWEIPAVCEINLIGDDRAILVIYDPAGGFIYNIEEAQFNTLRRALSHQVRIRPDSKEGFVHVWMFFISPNGKEVSNSRYFGSGVIDTQPA